MEKVIRDIKQLCYEFEMILSSKQKRIFKILSMINVNKINSDLSKYLIKEDTKGIRIHLKLFSNNNEHCPLSIYFGLIETKEKTVEMYNIFFGNSWAEDIEIYENENNEDNEYFLNILTTKVTEKSIFQNNKLCRIEYEYFIGNNFKVTSQDRISYVLPFLKKNVVTKYYTPWIDSFGKYNE